MLIIYVCLYKYIYMFIHLYISVPRSLGIMWSSLDSTRLLPSNFQVVAIFSSTYFSEMSGDMYLC